MGRHLSRLGPGSARATNLFLGSNAVVVQDVCWGSWNGPHTNDVPLLDIAEFILRVNVGGYSLEMANLATSTIGVFARR